MKVPTKVFFGVRVVKRESSAAVRPSESLATACTLYVVEAARWVDGVQLAPSPVIFPSTFVPLPSLTTTSVSLPFAAPILRAPLVSTALAPFSGAMVTTASDCSLCAAVASLALSPLPSPAPGPEPPPPHAVTVSISSPSTAPAIGRTFTLFSPRRAWPGPRPSAPARTGAS